MGPSAPYTSSERISARAKMEAFSDGDEWMPSTDEAIDIFWGDFEGTEVSGDMLVQSEHSLDSWMWFDYRLPDGGCMLDRFLERDPALSSGERKYLEQMRETAVRLYEIEAVVPGASITLRDLLTGASVTVRELSGSRALKRWDVVAARVAPVGASGEPEIDDILPQRRLGVGEFAEELRHELEAWRDENPGGNELYFFKTLAPWFHQEWLEAILSPQMPTLMMPDGEKALITVVRFQVLDRTQVIAALDKASDMDRDGEELRWLWLPRRRKKKEPPTWVRIEGDGLVLEALTKGSAERGRARLERLAGGALRAGLTTHQDLAQAMAESKLEPAPSLEDVPELDDLALEHYERHYRGWLDESIPALDGHSPREAARMVAIQPVLIDLLKDLEHQYSGSLGRGKPGYDPFWMWEELGLADAPEAPRRHRYPPRLGHESMERLVPGLADVVQGVARRIRRRADFGLETVVDETELRRDLSVRRFLETHARESVALGLTLEDAAEDADLLGIHLRCLCNFEIHRRKTFWVEESLSWMLARTNLDIAGDQAASAFYLPRTGFHRS